MNNLVTLAPTAAEVRAELEAAKAVRAVEYVSSRRDTSKVIEPLRTVRDLMDLKAAQDAATVANRRKADLTARAVETVAAANSTIVKIGTVWQLEAVYSESAKPAIDEKEAARVADIAAEVVDKVRGILNMRQDEDFTAAEQLALVEAELFPLMEAATVDTWHIEKVGCSVKFKVKQQQR